MRLNRHHVASLDEVRITREGEYAVIQFADSRVATTNLKLGPEVPRMPDQQILDRFRCG